MNGYNPVLIVLLACCLLIIPFKMLSAQNKQSDLALLQAVKPGQPYNPTPNPNNKKALQVKSPSAFAKYNPLSLTLTGSMYLYQNVLSAQLGRQCLYSLSCSNFSKQAIKEFGMVKGVFLTADRLLRCNRISALDLNLMTLNPKTRRFTDEPRQYRLHEHEHR